MSSTDFHTSVQEETPGARPSIAPEFTVEGQVVLILCGLIASGKSTFAESLQSHYPHFRRCNQDDLGDRRSVEKLARRSLAEGNSVCVDRTNFNASQRFYWIKIAREFPGTSIWVVVFDTPYEICAARLQHRTDHPTITSPEQGLSVLSRFAADFESPEAHEGYDRILYLKPSDHPAPEYSRADVSAILQRVGESKPAAAQARAASSPGFTGNPPSQRGLQQGRGRPYPGGWRGRCALSPAHGNRQDVSVGSYVPTGISTGFRGWNTSSVRGNNGVASRTGHGQGRGLPGSGARDDEENCGTGSSPPEMAGGSNSRDHLTVD